MNNWNGPTWGQWADTVDAINDTAKVADKNYKLAKEWKENSEKWQENAENWKARAKQAESKLEEIELEQTKEKVFEKLKELRNTVFETQLLQENFRKYFGSIEKAFNNDLLRQSIHKISHQTSENTTQIEPKNLPELAYRIGQLFCYQKIQWGEYKKFLEPLIIPDDPPSSAYIESINNLTQIELDIAHIRKEISIIQDELRFLEMTHS